MKQICYTVKDPEGVHALPASGLIKLAESFACEITAEGNGKRVDAKHVFGLVGLGVKQGQTLTLTFDGQDEDKAAGEIERYLQGNL